VVKLVGILNVTPDSFSDGGSYDNVTKSLQHYHQLIDDGADLIDIGAQSTSYGAKIISSEDEWMRLETLLLAIKDLSKISLDTFNPQTAQKGIIAGVGMINDVAAGTNMDMLQLIADNPQVKYVAMYSKSIPARKDIRAKSLTEILAWCEDIIVKCHDVGIKKDQLILDPGIGFSTDPALSFEVLRRTNELKKFGFPIYIGHSRKSFLEAISNVVPKERDLETVVASLYLCDKVDYLRVHNVSMHRRALNVWAELLS
jgi:dihydropteroate synthase